MKFIEGNCDRNVTVLRIDNFILSKVKVKLKVKYL